MKIVLVEDHTLVAEAITRSLLAGGHEPVGFARSGDEAVALVRAAEPDLVLLDLSLPGKEGLEVLAEMITTWPTLRVIVLTMWDDDFCRDRARRLGARGYLTKALAERTLLEAITTTGNGGEWFPNPSAGSDTKVSRLDHSLHITPRQHQILSLVAHGVGYKGMGSALGQPTAAVDGHVRRLHRLLNVTTKAELVRKAMEHGLLQA